MINYEPSFDVSTKRIFPLKLTLYAALLTIILTIIKLDIQNFCFSYLLLLLFSPSVGRTLRIPFWQITVKIIINYVFG